MQTETKKQKNSLLLSLKYIFLMYLSTSCMHTQIAKSCRFFCDPMDCSSPDSFVHGIFQARILEWVAMPFSRGYSQLKDQTHVSCIGRQVLYHWATLEAYPYSIPYMKWYEWRKKQFGGNIPINIILPKAPSFTK